MSTPVHDATVAPNLPFLLLYEVDSDAILMFTPVYDADIAVPLLFLILYEADLTRNIVHCYTVCMHTSCVSACMPSAHHLQLATCGDTCCCLWRVCCIGVLVVCVS